MDRQDADKQLLHLLDSPNIDPVYNFLREDHTFSQDTLNNALILACQHGHKFLVQSLVCLGGNVNTQDTYINTPLMICAKNGFTDIARYLIIKKADINAVNSAGDTALILSVRPAGSMEIMKLLLEQDTVNISHKNNHGHTAVMKAIEARDIDGLEILLKLNKQIRNENIKINSTSEQTLNSKCRRKDFRRIGLGEREEVTADKVGLGKIVQLFKDQLLTGVSVLVLAIDKEDLESIEMLLETQNFDSNIKKAINEAFSHMFYKCQLLFTDKGVAIVKRLLESGADVNSYSGTGFFFNESSMRLAHPAEKTVYIAAEKGRVDLIEALVQHGTKIDRFSDSALYCALTHGHTECARVLLKNGARIDVKTCIMSAVTQCKTECITFLFQNCEPEIMNLKNDKIFSSSLLISAIKTGNLEIIGQIIDSGFDINEPDFNGILPIVESPSREVAEFLLQKGAEVTKMIYHDHVYITPLTYLLLNMNICSSDTLAVVQFLLDNGACVNERDSNGRTPLMLAVLVAKCKTAVQMLVEHGAEFTAKDQEGKTALIHAIEQSLECVPALLQCNTDMEYYLNLQTNCGRTALMSAVTGSKLNLVEKLVDLGADVNIKDCHGNTALCLAVLHCQSREDILTTLIGAGSDINCQNNDGLSPLMLTAKCSDEKLMSLLLHFGADVNAVSCTDQSRTAISFSVVSDASKAVRNACLEMLLDKGASSFYASTENLHEIIYEGNKIIISKLIKNGLGPVDVKLCCFPCNYPLSSLHVALLAGNIDVAQYFLDNLFLIASDTTSLAHDKYLLDTLQVRGFKECLNLLHEMSSQPMSLFSLAFVSVTSCLGTGPGRESRVNMLPLPRKIKDKLLFKTEAAGLSFPTDSVRGYNSGDDDDDDDYFNYGDNDDHYSEDDS